MRYMCAYKTTPSKMNFLTNNYCSKLMDPHLEDTPCIRCSPCETNDEN